eukprot:TRINITY_DN85_c0_g1_i1.p2 TRINITY_DN85_c0_g1~~TRINITY_DN85_c0_g1_i1.p2  ORF type:complete len:134 (-),score=6.24 TRINITY_DN85_c0_g1_i1:503-904(-)
MNVGVIDKVIKKDRGLSASCASEVRGEGIDVNQSKPVNFNLPHEEVAMNCCCYKSFTSDALTMMMFSMLTKKHNDIFASYPTQTNSQSLLSQCVIHSDVILTLNNVHSLQLKRIFKVNERVVIVTFHRIFSWT